MDLFNGLKRLGSLRSIFSTGDASPQEKEDDSTAVATSTISTATAAVGSTKEGKALARDASINEITIPRNGISAEIMKEATRKFEDTLRFIAISEETKSSARCYGKDYEGKDDWTRNHFLMLDQDDRKANEVIFSSYFLDSLSKKLATVAEYSYTRTSFSNEINLEATSTLPSSPGHWLRFTAPTLERRPPMPQVPPQQDEDEDEDEGEGDQIRNYLLHQMNRYKTRFQDCDIDDAPIHLMPEDLPQPDLEHAANVREFVLSALKYQVDEELTNLYKKLFELQAKQNSDTYEIVLGLGHVRALYSKGKGSEKTIKIINGPLLEVVASLKLDDNKSILVIPCEKTKVKLNGEVMSALITGCDANSAIATELSTMAQDLEDATSLKMSHFLQKALQVCWNAVLRKPNDMDVHDPPQNDQPALVLTPAWCLQWRKRMVTDFSKDALSLVKASQEGKLKISNAVFVLMEGPGALEKNGPLIFTDSIEEDGLVYPLPASRAQRRIGYQLFVKNEPAILVQGPPGTGKTHSIVNVVCMGLSFGRKVLLSSTNSRALQAAVEKMPKQLRYLCIDTACCEEGGLSKLHRSLLTLQKQLTNALQQKDRIESKIEELQLQIRDKKAERSKLELADESIRKETRSLFKNPGLCMVLLSALEIADKFPCMVRAALNMDALNFNEVTELAEVLVSSQNSSSDKTVSMVVGSVSAELIDLVSKEAVVLSEKSKEDMGTEYSEPGFKFSPTKSIDMYPACGLSEVKVDGKSPTSPQDWQEVLSRLQHMRACQELQHALICSKQDIWDEEKGGTQQGFLECLDKAKELKANFEKMSDTHQTAVRKLIEDPPKSGWSQKEHQRLTKDIQDLESNLVFSKVIVALNYSLTDNDRSKLVELTQITGRLNNRILSTAGSTSDKACRHRDDLTEVFREALKVMPFLVMTTEQVSKFVPPDHKFDVAILDEASQSNCCALTMVARASQVLIVGDDKQVSPSQCFLAEERISELKLKLPNIALKKHLLPESSFFDLFKPAFPTKHVLLHEHFRCVPGIIKVSNSMFYDNSLEPLRLPGKGAALVVDHVNGERDPKKKCNAAEAARIADLVELLISEAVKGRKRVFTIGIISMGGESQCEVIREHVENKVDPLRERFGSGAVERHKIRIGVPSQFQGDERDVVLLSAVYGGGKRIASETDPADWKKWNVALTRAKDRMWLVHSFKRNALKNKSDIRIQVFEHFYSKSTTCSGSNKEGWAQEDASFVRTKAENMLKVGLTRCGYNVVHKGDRAWASALCVGQPGSHCALVCVQNSGESQESWEQMLDEQESLVRAGRACLRVDSLSLALNPKHTFQDVLQFLADSNVQKNPVVAKEEKANDKGTSTNSTISKQVVLTLHNASTEECKVAASESNPTAGAKSKRPLVQSSMEGGTPVASNEDHAHTTAVGKRSSDTSAPLKKKRRIAITDSDDED